MNFNLDFCESYESEIIEAILDVVQRKKYILSDHGLAFEREFAAYLGMPFCAGVGNGTDAIRIALKAFAIGEGDEVISPAHNVAYTALAVRATKAKNVFVDVDPDIYCLDPEKIESAITGKTRAIIPVHLYGQTADMIEIKHIAEKYKLIVIEDAAQAHGATHNWVFAGCWGDAAAFSFYPTKNLGAFGEAGGIVTKYPVIDSLTRVLRDGGRIDRYLHKYDGLNSCLDEIQAAVLRVKLKYLDQSNKKRQQLAERYRVGLDRKYTTPRCGVYNTHVYHLYVLQHPQRDRIVRGLNEAGIPSLIHYPVPVPMQPVFVQESQGQGPWPVAEKLARQVFSIPMFPDMTDHEQDTVIKWLNALA